MLKSGQRGEAEASVETNKKLMHGRKHGNHRAVAAWPPLGDLSISTCRLAALAKLPGSPGSSGFPEPGMARQAWPALANGLEDAPGLLYLGSLAMAVLTWPGLTGLTWPSWMTSLGQAAHRSYSRPWPDNSEQSFLLDCPPT